MDSAVCVACYPVTANSNYVPLLFAGMEHRYRPEYLPAGAAIGAIGGGGILHIHWEEFILRNCRSDADADHAAADFARQLAAVKASGTAVAWTMHNELPHEIGFHRQFLAIRQLLAQTADVILIHNATSLQVLASQVDVDESRVRLLPHPSYLGRLEDEESLLAGLEQQHDSRLQGFGWIRLQKGFGEMIALLPVDFLEARNVTIRISGQGADAAATIARQQSRADVEWDVRYVPDAETPQLLRSALCVVLPYDRVLTSGVALLAMSVGAIVVAVDVPQLRELLPTASQRFLFERGNGLLLRAAIDDVLSLSAAERRAVIDANLEVAQAVRPARIAEMLAAIYDSIIIA